MATCRIRCLKSNSDTEPMECGASVNGGASCFRHIVPQCSHLFRAFRLHNGHSEYRQQYRRTAGPHYRRIGRVVAHLHFSIVLLTSPCRIGGACARELFSRHVHLALSYNSSQENVQKLSKQLVDDYVKTHPDRHPPRITCHAADLSNADATVRLASEASEEHGRPVEILIANAGFGKRITDIEEIPLDVFEHTLNVNLRAPFLLAKSVVGSMKQKRWGRIIFISSIAGYGVGLNGCRTSDTFKPSSCILTVVQIMQPRKEASHP